MYRTVIPDVNYENLVSWNTYANNFSTLCCLKDIVVEVTKSHPSCTILQLCIIGSCKIGRPWLRWFCPDFPQLSVLKDVFFPPGFTRLSSLLTLTMSSFPPLKWKMYFLKAWNVFPPAKLSAPWNEFLTANLILPSNTSSKQHRPDSISHWSRWSITS